MIEIRKLTEETLPLLGSIEDRRLDSERVLVRLKPGGFDVDYKPLPGALWRVGNITGASLPEPRSFLERSDMAAYLAWLDGALAGQLLLDTAENGLARVRDIRVATQMRRHGVGEALLTLAEEWARGRGLTGLLAETQDVNAGACQFLTQCGYVLGGVDTMRYIGRSMQTLRVAGLRETALMFYKFIQ